VQDYIYLPLHRLKTGLSSECSISKWEFLAEEQGWRVGGGGEYIENY
jgi:hypothetical protein